MVVSAGLAAGGVSVLVSLLPTGGSETYWMLSKFFKLNDPTRVAQRHDMLPFGHHVLP